MIAARSQMEWRLVYVFTMIMSKYELTTRLLHPLCSLDLGTFPPRHRSQSALALQLVNNRISDDMTVWIGNNQLYTLTFMHPITRSHRDTLVILARAEVDVLRPLIG